jgi:hypothetical protein
MLFPSTVSEMTILPVSTSESVYIETQLGVYLQDRTREHRFGSDFASNGRDKTAFYLLFVPLA